MHFYKIFQLLKQYNNIYITGYQLIKLNHTINITIKIPNIPTKSSFTDDISFSHLYHRIIILSEKLKNKQV